MNSQQVKRLLGYGVLWCGLSLPWHAHADASASAVLSDLSFLALDLDPLDGIDPTYMLEGELAGHVYLAAGDQFFTHQTRSLQGDVPLDLGIAIGGASASANARASALPSQLSVNASAKGSAYHFASGEASLGAARPDRDFMIGIDLAPRSVLIISVLGSVQASASGLAGCPNVSFDASMLCEAQRAHGLVSGALRYSYQSGGLIVSSSQFDAVSKGVSLTPVYDFAPEELGFYLQIVDPAPDESVQASRRMYFAFSNASSDVQHADLRLYASAGAGGGIPSVPEPSAIACLALGLATLGWRRVKG